MSRLFAVCAASVCFSGCGGSPYAPVSGVVTYQGNPLPGATVTFQPVGGGEFSYGITDDNGAYRLMVAEIKGQAGARVGQHQVKITAIADPDANGSAGDSDLGSLVLMTERPAKVRYLAPPRYDNFETSGLSFKVPSGGSDEADFALTE